MIEAYKHLWGTMIQFLTPFLTAFAAVLVLTPVMILVARRFKVLDIPNERKLHHVPVPRLGGLGIIIAFWIASLFNLPWSIQFTAVLVASTLVGLMGVVDDARGLSSVIRLVGQLIAAIIVISAGLFVSFMPHVWWGYLVAYAVTMVWLLGIVNGLNFLDGLDGLASGITAIAALFFFLIAVYLRQLDVAFISALLVAGALGFLVYNFRPAKIYLGDGGSTFLGFMLASIALYGGWSDGGFVVALGIPTIILGVIIFDMIYITVSRIKSRQVRTFREWLDYTGKDHFHHRLMSLGFGETRAVIFIYLVCISLGLNVLVLERLRNSLGVAIQFLNASLHFLIILLLMRVGREYKAVKK